MPVTFRSVIIGLVLIPVNCVYLVVAEVLWMSGSPTSLSLFYNVVFVLFWMVLANLVLKRWKPAWALEPSELFVVYTMLSLSTALCSIDMLDFLPSTMAHLDYYGPLKGEFGEFKDFVPSWLTVHDPDVLEAYYVGQESVYDPRILSAWAGPLFHWFCFVLALCAVMWGLDLVFRKQWTENEKLAYPVIQVPLQLVNEPLRLFRSRGFWIGFLIAATIDLLNGVNFLLPLVPGIPVVHVVDIQSFFHERPWSDMGPTWASFYPFAIGMCFFMPLDLSFSCWFFYIFFKLERVGASHIGAHGMPGFPFIEEQTAGGYYAVALTALWITRKQLAKAGRLILGRPVDRATPWDRSEARLAALLMAVGGAFLIGFTLTAGMSLGVVLVFFLLYYTISVAVTRMRAELGHPSHDLHFIGANIQIVKFLGAAEMRASNPRDLTMLGFFNFFTRAYRAHPMPHGLEAMRIAERMKMSQRRYLWAMAAAIVMGIVCSFWAYLWAMNRYGAAQLSAVSFYYGQETWGRVEQWFTAPLPRQPEAAYAILIGLVFCLGLSALRMAVAWFPFHPVGYAVSGSWSMENLWMCFFVAWFIKLVLLKYGGAKAYRPAVPFFVGLILGDFILGSIWTIYGVVRGINVYHFWPY